MRQVLALVCVITWAASPLAASAQSSNDLQVGQVVGNELGQVVNGWEQIGGSDYQLRTTQNYVTTEISECCVTKFKRGSTYLFAQMEPIARRATGGVEAGRILQITKIVIPQNEVSTDCSLMWISPVSSFYNPQTKIIRSIIFSGTKFVQIRWFDTGSYCDHGD